MCGEPAKLVGEKANSADLQPAVHKADCLLRKRRRMRHRSRAGKEQSVFLTHNALNGLHPVASNTGDLTEAATAAGLSEAQVRMVLPRLRIFLGSMLR
jgi:hypothetical protein